MSGPRVVALACLLCGGAAAAQSPPSVSAKWSAYGRACQTNASRLESAKAANKSWQSALADVIGRGNWISDAYRDYVGFERWQDENLPVGKRCLRSSACTTGVWDPTHRCLGNGNYTECIQWMRVAGPCLAETEDREACALRNLKQLTFEKARATQEQAQREADERRRVEDERRQADAQQRREEEDRRNRLADERRARQREQFEQNLRQNEETGRRVGESVSGAMAPYLADRAEDRRRQQRRDEEEDRERRRRREHELGEQAEPSASPPPAPPARALDPTRDVRIKDVQGNTITVVSEDSEEGARVNALRLASECGSRGMAAGAIKQWSHYHRGMGGVVSDGRFASATCVPGAVPPPASGLGPAPSTHANALAAGQRVSCNWKRLGTRYNGVVESVEHGKLNVHYDDNDRELADPDQCTPLATAAPAQPSTFGAGQRVSCNWKRRGARYSGTVESIQNGKLNVHYDDNDRELADPDQCTALVARTAASATAPFNSRTCAWGNGRYCGAALGMEEDALYDCRDGEVTLAMRCPKGCATMPRGTNDVCRE